MTAPLFTCEDVAVASVSAKYVDPGARMLSMNDQTDSPTTRTCDRAGTDFDRQAAIAALARPDYDINHVIAYGQSLATGYEGWPALSVTQPYDSLMLGDSVRALKEQTRDWRVTGGPMFRPLVATVQDIVTGELLSPEQVALLKPGGVSPGETVLEGAVNLWRGRMLGEGVGLGHRRLLASACGAGGRSLEALSKGAPLELFNRLRDCASLARKIANDANLSYSLTAVLFLQGEANSWGLQGSTSDCSAYRELLQNLYHDILEDVARGIANHRPPAMFLYQTGGTYANEDNTIAQAQLDVALQTPGCFLVAPVYPVTEKSGHLDANGYRWLGAQFGKVMHRVLTMGEDWRPLHPQEAVVEGRRLHVAFHVPVEPLAWGRPIVGHRLVDPADRGFTVVDDVGILPLESVDLHGEREVVLTLSRQTNGAVRLRYGDKRHGGRGSLRDSDDEMAPDRYEYAPGKGHYESANIPELVGRQYPLHNWCVAFSLAVRVNATKEESEDTRLAPGPVDADTEPLAVQALRDVARSGIQVVHPPQMGAWDVLRSNDLQAGSNPLPNSHGWIARLRKVLLRIRH